MTTWPRSTFRHSSGVATSSGLLTSGLIINWSPGVHRGHPHPDVAWLRFAIFLLQAGLPHILPRFSRAMLVISLHCFAMCSRMCWLRAGPKELIAPQDLSLGGTSPPEFLSFGHLGSFRRSPHWLILFGFLFQFLELLPEFVKAWWPKAHSSLWC